MRKILLLSAVLALFLVVIINIQRMVVLAMTNRPFLGNWAQDPQYYPGGRPIQIRFERGGTVWISGFGEPRRQAHWEDGLRGQEIVVTGLDPAQPNVQQSFHWHISRDHLTLFPLASPSAGGRVFRTGASGFMGFSYTRVSSLDWPTPKSFVGRWVPRFGRPIQVGSVRSPRTFVGRFTLQPGMVPGGRASISTFRTINPRRVLLDLQPDGVLGFYEEGHARRHGYWTADEIRHTFTVAVDAQGPGSGSEIWNGQIVPGPGDDTRIELSAPRQVSALRLPSVYLSDHVGSFTRVADTPANQRPFLGVWRINPRSRVRHFQLELLPGGELRVTEADGSSRQGTWKEMGPWPRLTLTGLDPEHPDRSRDWLWSHEQGHRFLVHDAHQREFYRSMPELLELFDANAAVTDRKRGTHLVAERVLSSGDTGPRP